MAFTVFKKAFSSDSVDEMLDMGIMKNLFCSGILPALFSFDYGSIL